MSSDKNVAATKWLIGIGKQSANSCYCYLVIAASCQVEREGKLHICHCLAGLLTFWHSVNNVAKLQLQL